MSSGRQDTWSLADFAVTRGPDLVRLAYAVTGDPATAHECTVAALGRLGRDWVGVLEGGSPLREGRRAVLREVLRAPQGAAAFGVEPAAAVWDESTEDGSDEDDPLHAVLQAYAALARPVRAALALSVLDGLEVAQVAEATGDSVLETEFRLGSGRDLLIAARRPRGRRPVDGQTMASVDQDLADALQRSIADASLDTDVDGPVAARVAARGRRTRRLAAGGVAVALLATGTAAVATLARTSDRSPTLSTGTSSTAGRPVATTGYASWPVRGALARDQRMLDTIARAGIPDWHIDSFTTEVGAARVIWADHVDGEVLAVAAYPFFDATRTRVTGTALGFFRGSEPALVQRDPNQYPTEDDDVIAVTTGQDAGRSLVVVPGPTVQDVRWSSRLSYGQDGSATRADWRTLDVRSGAAVVGLGDTRAWTVAVRAGDRVATVAHLVGSSTGDAELWNPSIQGSAAAIDARLTALVTSQVAALSGVPPAQVRTRIVVSPVLSGDLSPGYFDTGDRERVLVLFSTLPSGAVLRTVMVHQASPLPGARASTVQIPAVLAAKDADRQPVVLAHPPSDNAAGPTAVVLCPGAHWVTVHTDGGGDATTAVRDGVARAPISLVDSSGSVTTFDARHRPIGTWPWPTPGEQDAFGLGG